MTPRTGVSASADTYPVSFETVPVTRASYGPLMTRKFAPPLAGGTAVPIVVVPNVTSAARATPGPASAMQSAIAGSNHFSLFLEIMPILLLPHSGPGRACNGLGAASTVGGGRAR